MSKGLIGGGAIKISPDNEATMGLLIGEGIETVLSASKRFQFKPCWSLVSAGGVSNFPVLPGIETVTIAVDNDPEGKGEQVAEECAERLLAGGIEVITAQTEFVKDFNDLIPCAQPWLNLIRSCWASRARIRSRCERRAS